MTLESSVVPQRFIRTGHVLRQGPTRVPVRLTGFKRVVYYSSHRVCNCYLASFFFKPSFNLMHISFCVVSEPRFRGYATTTQATVKRNTVHVCKQDMLEKNEINDRLINKLMWLCTGC